MRLNIVVGSTDGAYRYSGGFRNKRQDEFSYKKEDDVNTNANEEGKPAGGGRRGGGRGGYNNNNDRRGNNNNKKKNDQDKKTAGEKAPVEEDPKPAVVNKAPPKIMGYIPGAELEEDEKSVIQPSSGVKNTNPVPENPGTEPEITKTDDTVTEPALLPAESEVTTEISPGTPKPEEKTEHSKLEKTEKSVSIPKEEKKPRESPHPENGSLKAPEISLPYTFDLNIPLDTSITTGEQTFLDIDGTLYLKIQPPDPDTPTPNWYTHLQHQFQLSKNPPKTHQKNPKKKPDHFHEKKSGVVPEVKNGKLIFPVKVPENIILLEEGNKKPQNSNHNVVVHAQKKKNN